eukprot:CAMPEP_0113944824 /NCGR_PEP_ID=MMETSP1339-20121228/37121_1 /TAXON_ID=94617 /ORGANISM="Fibrocapsa japonica" /LENGTH=278 /DNA_ID=CAMNT_0000950155 /DNA_START=75 /DNA_END=911 /DNA_ORIENTATION=+ /assembly_acc=CAM_ASM_000762
MVSSGALFVFAVFLAILSRSAAFIPASAITKCRPSSNLHSSKSSRDVPSEFDAVDRREFLRSASAGLITSFVLFPKLADQAAAVGPFPSLKNQFTAIDANLPYETTENGIKIIDYEVGTGISPNFGQAVTINYIEYIKTEQSEKFIELDNTYASKIGFLMKHGNGRQIPGVEEGIHTMRVGGKRRIIIPRATNLGYIESAFGPVGPIPVSGWQLRKLEKILGKMTNTGELVFDVELMAAFDDEADLGYYSDEVLTPDDIVRMIEKARKEEAEAEAAEG